VTPGRVASLAAYLEQSAARFPGRCAVVDPDGGQLTYAELDSRAEHIAAFLAEHGVLPGDRVALVMPKSAATVIALFGVLKARAAYVPVDCTAPAERIRTILADGQMRVAFVDRRYAAVLDTCTHPLDLVIWVGGAVNGAASSSIARSASWEAVLSSNATPISRSERSREDLAYILYTSGSTGVPKGVMLSHGNALSFVDWCSEVFQPSAEDRFSSHAPFHFDLSVLDLFVSLKHGAALHLIDVDTGKNPKELAALIAQRRLTVWYSTPSILRLLYSSGNLPQFDYSALRLVLFAGEVFPVKHLRALKKHLPRPRYFNLYGPTETNVCTYAEIPGEVPEERSEPYPIGWPCSHCASLVLDAEQRPVAPGEEGLLYIAGESVFQGYWNRPKENAAAFYVREGTPWYSTGDVVREDPAQGLIYLGRRDRMVKRHGYRIELDDIECALYKHEGLREASVVATPSGSDVKIVAYLAAGASATPSIIELKMFCAKHLPTYMNPDVFVFLDALPRTSTNKVDYQSLRARTASLQGVDRG
jgi:amino acid adenylation domain-containing protein